MWQALVFSHGGTMLTADEKKVAFDGPAGQKAIDVLGRLVNEANMPNSTSAALQPDFIAGRLGMMRSFDLGADRRFNREVGDTFPLLTAAKFPIQRRTAACRGRRVADDVRQGSGQAEGGLGVHEVRHRPARRDDHRQVDGLRARYGRCAAEGSARCWATSTRTAPTIASRSSSCRSSTAWYAFPGENGVKITDVIKDHLQTVVAKTAKPDDVLRR